MSTKERVYNFNPGPACLPFEALETFSQDIILYQSTGMGVLEISHRSKDFEAILEDAKDLLKEILSIPDTHEVLFLQGGASLQFAMIPMNFLKQGTADYIITGSWSKKAIKEAKFFGNPQIAASTEDENFTRLPKQEEIKLSDNAAYVHITSNNTIFGTQWHTFPEVGNRPLVADMSSDILSRSLDVGKFHLIYAGAQKNLGPAGVTVVMIRKDWVDQAQKDIPTLLAYKTHLEKNSLFNTPPVGAIRMVQLVLQWVKSKGGIKAMEAQNRQKAELLYQTIDEMGDFYRGTVTDKASRSWMNVPFRLPTEDLEKTFLQKAMEHNLYGLKGHRSVGGIRVSMYNAMPLEGIERLCDFMKAFYKSR